MYIEFSTVIHYIAHFGFIWRQISLYGPNLIFRHYILLLSFGEQDIYYHKQRQFENRQPKILQISWIHHVPFLLLLVLSGKLSHCSNTPQMPEKLEKVLLMIHGKIRGKIIKRNLAKCRSRKVLSFRKVLIYRARRKVCNVHTYL